MVPRLCSLPLRQRVWPHTGAVKSQAEKGWDEAALRSRMTSRTHCRQGEQSGCRCHRARITKSPYACGVCRRCRLCRAEGQGRGEREGGQQLPAGQAWGSVTDSMRAAAPAVTPGCRLPSHSCPVGHCGRCPASRSRLTLEWPISQPPHRHLFPLISVITNQGHLDFLKT